MPIANPRLPILRPNARTAAPETRRSRPPARAAFFVVALLACASVAEAASRAAADRDWPVYLGDTARSHYSPLDQINRTNVRELEVAWTFRAGDIPTGVATQIQCSPLVVGRTLYGTTPMMTLFALDAVTGRELWRYDPRAGKEKSVRFGQNRGVVYWAEGDDRRILCAVDNFLYAVNARDGKPVASFGEDGRIDLKAALGAAADNLPLVSNTPGVVFEDIIIMPTRVSETNPAAPGHICAYDIRTGKLRWMFHTIPRPGEFGYETWPPDAWQRTGAANCWAGMALDTQRGLVYVPTGSATSDFWGGDRAGANLFANSLLCLDARTGKRVWHYQIVHHDMWDRDLPAPPNLITLRRDGKTIPAVAQVTKHGLVFVFHRETGEPLFPIEERPVPRSDIPGESVWPTQPFPTAPAPFSRQLYTYDLLPNLTPEIHREALDHFTKFKPHAPFMPFSREGTIVLPGLDGGAEWGGVGADPEGILYVNASDTPWVMSLREVDLASAGKGAPAAMFSLYCASCHGTNLAGNPLQNIPSLVGVGSRRTRDELLAHVAAGKGMMPGFSFLPEAQRAVLVDYILGRSAADRVAPDSAGKIEMNSGPAGRVRSAPFVANGYTRWMAGGYPAIKPPWGTLSAIDLNTGEYRWRVPLGEYPELIAKGLPPTGTDNYGGPVVTAGGLVFIAATRDEFARVFDRDNGKELWRAKLPAAGYATPLTYQIEGRQYFVIACGGGKLGTPSGDAYVAFALPKR